MTPDRSENIPPSAARISGVESRIDEKISEIVKSSATCPASSAPQAKERLAEQRFGRDKQDDRRLQYLHDVLRDVLRERVHRNAAAAGIVLILMTLSLNAAAIAIRYRLRRRIKW